MTNQKQSFWTAVIIISVAVISILHYTTPTMQWQYHLVYMQAYFIPIILAAFLFGVRGGLGTAIVVSILYFPHIMLHWGGLIENNLMRFLQIGLFNILGYLTGLKAQGEQQEKEKFQTAAQELEKALQKQQQQSEQISEIEQQLLVSDRLATIGELTASLAHEVRNPLGSIRGAVEIIRDAVPDDIKKLEFFDILIEDTQRLNAVVENYLSFSKKQTRQIISYNFKEAVSHIVLMADVRARKSNIRISTKLPDEIILVKGDPNQLWQAMMNVLFNAVQAMPDGGEIQIKAENTEMLVDGQSVKQEAVRLIITDQGPGIGPDKLQEVFKPFFTTRAEGTGLGLAIVNRLAEENKWQININSRLNEGTEFTFIIPLKSESE